MHLPELPHGIALTGISFAPGEVRLTGTFPQWHLELPRKRLEDTLNQLSAVGRPLTPITWSIDRVRGSIKGHILFAAAAAEALGLPGRQP